MKKLDLRDLATHVRVILTCMPRADRNAGGWRSEQAVRSAAEKIMALFGRAVVLVPDDVYLPGSELASPSWRPGEFGVTEPWPFEPGCRPPVTPKPPSESNAG